MADEGGTDEYAYEITFSPFRIEQYANGILTQVVNPADTLRFEKSSSETSLEQDTCFDVFKRKEKLQ